MKELNIPVFRAKKIDSDEYVIGYYYKQLEFSYILEHEVNKQKEEVSMWGSGWGFNQVLQKTQVDPTTLAIHFPDMIDSEENKIFASLSKDGKGGDILNRNNDTPYTTEEGKKILSEWVALYKNDIMQFQSTKNSPILSFPYFNSNKKDMKVIGIQK